MSISFDTSDMHTVSLNTSITFCTLVNFDISDIKRVHTTYMYFLTFDTSNMHIIETIINYIPYITPLTPPTCIILFSFNISVLQRSLATQIGRVMDHLLPDGLRGTAS